MRQHSDKFKHDMLTQASPDMFQAFRRTHLSGWHMLQAAALIFLAALAGLLTQPASGLSVLWPANALLAGLLLRNPGLARPAMWVAAGAALALADIAWGKSPLHALSYGLVNLVGAYAAWRLLAASNATLNNGSKDVPSYLLDPIAVDNHNLQQTVVADGFVSQAALAQ